MTTYTPLRMIAEDKDDLQVIAACLQDALIPLSSMSYDKEKGHFHLVANRFCWECNPEILEGSTYYSRVAAALVFHDVQDIQRKALDLQNDSELVNLLTIHHEEGDCIYLVFSGGSEIKLKVNKVCCHLRDVDEPYPTMNKPCHSEVA
ncbi:MAG: DUF2948 family protein [Alphaproteobacteria bacterium]|nr:DUF2948 family protein [Alphaproteobacteria bacterium]